MHRFAERLSRRHAVTNAALTVAEKQLGVKLPDAYVEFLRLTNGGEGFIGENAYVMLWGVEELASVNQSYEAHKYAPGLLLFGSDGGGEAYGFDTRSPEWSIVQVPFVGMDWSLARHMGTSFGAFLQLLHEVE